MKFGPFSEQHFEKIRNVLETEDIPFFVDSSVEAIQAWRKSRATQRPIVHPTFGGMLECLFVEIPDEELPRLGNKLEQFGILEPVDRPTELDAFDDFICPQCDFSGHATQLCPKHRVPLVSFSEKVAIRNAKSPIHQKLVAWILAILAIAALFARLHPHLFAHHR